MTNTKTDRGALDGLRVIDLARTMGGAFCGMMLGDLGADVVKVEPPIGDAARDAPMQHAPGAAAPFLAVNRNKRGITLDLERPEGARVLRRLAAGADVLVESYPTGVPERIGIGADALCAENARLVYCSISDFGRTGPYAERGGSDVIAQGMSGIMSATGDADGPPAKVGVPVTDLGAGLWAVFGILCALRARRVTGRGQRVDTSRFEAGLALSAWEAAEYWYAGQIPRRLGTAHRLNAPYQAFRASDGHFTVGAANRRLWPRFCALLGLEPLIDDPRFKDVGDRLRNQRDLEREIEAVTTRHSRAHWLEGCEAAGIPAGPIYSVPEALADPHARARAMVHEYDYPGIGRLRALGNPVKLSASPARFRRPAPRLGEHTDAVLAEIGYAPEDVADLRARGAV